MDAAAEPRSGIACVGTGMSGKRSLGCVGSVARRRIGLLWLGFEASGAGRRAGSGGQVPDRFPEVLVFGRRTHVASFPVYGADSTGIVRLGPLPGCRVVRFGGTGMLD